jgi:FAD synthetase
MVAALDAVDGAHLGDPNDVFVPIERLDPDVIVLGFDQHHDEAGIAEALAARDIDCRVERASGREPRYEDELLSSGDIVDRVLRRRGTDEVGDEASETAADDAQGPVDASRDSGERR